MALLNIGSAVSRSLLVVFFLLTATSSAISSDDAISSNHPCHDIIERCNEDEDCVACTGLNTDVDYQQRYFDCLDRFPFDEDSPCDLLRAIPCCLLEAAPSGIDCSAKELVIEALQCTVESLQVESPNPGEDLCSFEEQDVPASCGDGEGGGGGGDESSMTTFTPAPAAAVAAETLSPLGGTGATSAPSGAPLSIESTSARDLDLTPSPTTAEVGDGSENAPATSSSISSHDAISSNDPCHGIVERCNEDEDCVACAGLNQDVDDLERYLDCLDRFPFDEEFPCDLLGAVVCCLLEAAPPGIDCSADELVVDTWQCQVESLNSGGDLCSFEEQDVPASCGDGEGGAEVFEGEDGNGAVANVGRFFSAGVFVLVLLVPSLVALL